MMVMGIIPNVWRPWVMVVKVKGMLIKVPTTTNPLDLFSIPILAEETSTKAITPTTMCLIEIQPLRAFLCLMGIGHTSKGHDPTTTYHILLHNHHQTLLQTMITFPLK